MAALGDEDVCGLDVAMDDAFAVGGIQRVGDFDGEPSRTSISSGRPAMRCFSVTPSRYSMAMKAWPFCFADVVDGADVGMIQSGSGLRLAPEALERLTDLWATSSGRNFSATKRSQARVFGLVDDAHAAAAQLFDDAVVRDGLADHS